MFICQAFLEFLIVLEGTIDGIPNMYQVAPNRTVVVTRDNKLKKSTRLLENLCWNIRRLRLRGRVRSRGRIYTIFEEAWSLLRVGAGGLGHDCRGVNVVGPWRKLVKLLSTFMCESIDGDVCFLFQHPV